EERGGEGDRGPASGLLFRELPHDPALGVGDEPEDPVRVDLLLEDPVMVMEADLLSGLLAGRDDLPERGGNELLDRLVPFDQQRERGGLDATDGQEALAPLLGGEGKVAGQEGTPDEVDLLARFGRLGERSVELFEMREACLDRVARERAVLGPLHLDLGMDLLEELEALEPDELALAVEVGRDDDAVELADDRLEGRDDPRLGDPLERPGLEELRKAGERPLGELLRVVELDDVAAQPHDGVGSFRAVEPEDVRPFEAGAFHPPIREHNGDPEGGVELLGHDESANHGSIIRPGAVDKIRGRLTPADRSERERARSTGAKSPTTVLDGPAAWRTRPPTLYTARPVGATGAAVTQFGRVQD